jgi:hypothetical protein
MKIPFTIYNNQLLIGRHTSISFNRTLRVPEDGQKYDLPSGFGKLPIIRVSDVAEKVPSKWRDEGGLIIPLYQREALFLEFSGVKWRPTIAKVAVGKINAITGREYDLALKKGRQDYVVIPVQKWLDGINSEKGYVKQFVAMPLGYGYTVEAQVTDEEKHGGFQIAAYDPRDGVFSDPKPSEYKKTASQESILARPGAQGSGGKDLFQIPPTIAYAAPRPSLQIEMGIASGGTIKQQIFHDEYGVNIWNADSVADLRIHIVNSEVFSEITGLPMPETPISEKAYIKNGVPLFWFSVNWKKRVEELMSGRVGFVV